MNTFLLCFMWVAAACATIPEQQSDRFADTSVLEASDSRMARVAGAR
ncbi:hypothetical protein SAMN05444008_103175 [Cnuella takakiae]|uniref:Uncharacterized protein n=1 Tax=Cnuella takakiae TaxID=1302690 RepID=A0A1M4WX91_9BACT|nr:hypothetical protein [Cnuella takakiae]SHE85849.1 hypothetical protein SAMN05444008_103175 [Cnuella takakiae]